MSQISNKHHALELNKLLQPVFKYMQQELHPHCTLIITPTDGELVEGFCVLKADEIVDEET